MRLISKAVKTLFQKVFLGGSELITREKWYGIWYE